MKMDFKAHCRELLQNGEFGHDSLSRALVPGVLNGPWHGHCTVPLCPLFGHHKCQALSESQGTWGRFGMPVTVRMERLCLLQLVWTIDFPLNHNFAFCLVLILCHHVPTAQDPFAFWFPIRFKYFTVSRYENHFVLHLDCWSKHFRLLVRNASLSSLKKETEKSMKCGISFCSA